MVSLFPRLPDEIGLQCLLRVKLNSHHNLRCVCKSWNAALKSPHFYQERKRLNISEQRICTLKHVSPGVVVVNDLRNNSCRSLPTIPAEIKHISCCYFVKQKLVVFIWSWIWVYDFSDSGWRQGVNMPFRLMHFASAADEQAGLIYVAGGYGSPHNPVRCASVYNVEENKWDLLLDMNTNMKTFRGVFADGKFYVMDRPTCPTFEVFDSYTRSWRTRENRLNSTHFLNVFGRLYCFSDRRLIEYDYSQDKLHILGLLPINDCVQFIKFPIIVGHEIFLNIWDTIEDVGLYRLALPSETGGQFKLIGLERSSGILQDSAICAAIQMDL